MVKTRSHCRKSASAKRSYKRRVKASVCRGKGPAVCRGTKGCKYASGKKRSFCRKTKITRRRRGGKKQKGGNMFSKAALPFGLWGLKHMYSRKRK